MVGGSPAATPPLVIGAHAPRSVWVRAGHRSLARPPWRLSPQAGVHNSRHLGPAPPAPEPRSGTVRESATGRHGRWGRGGFVRSPAKPLNVFQASLGTPEDVGFDSQLVRPDGPLPTLRLLPQESVRTTRGVAWIGSPFAAEDVHFLTLAAETSEGAANRHLVP